MGKRPRLDILLVEKGLFETRAKAQAAVMAGQVLVDGRPATKAGEPVSLGSKLELIASCPYVSRGGVKLAGALDAFGIQPQDRVALDCGSSTGGFTDCLLQRGAAKVYAIDVGTAQLDAKLRADPRVVSRERTHARALRPEQFDPRPELCVVDCSFISLTMVLPHLVPCLATPFEIVALVKPQFEVGPKLAPKGVVRDPAARQAAIEKVRESLKALPLREAGLVESPIRGPKGNAEFFLHLKSK